MKEFLNEINYSHTIKRSDSVYETFEHNFIYLYLVIKDNNYNSRKDNERILMCIKRSSSVILNFKLNCFNKIINYNNIKYSNLIYSENDENWGKFSISNAIQNDYLILLVPPYIIIN